MSGRGGKGGRFNHKGRGNNASKQKNSAKQDAKKTLDDYIYYLGSAKHAADFESTTAFLTNRIRGTFDYGNDIALSLENLELINLDAKEPVLLESEATDEETRAHENKQFEIMYEIQIDHYVKRVSILKDNLIKAYFFLWEQGSEGMQDKIESRDDFRDIRRNPIRLLQAIKEEQLLNFQQHRLDAAVIHEALTNLLTMRQKHGESLQDYTQRFKTAKEIMESHIIGGPLVLPTMIKTTEGYDANDPSNVEECTKKANERFWTYVYMEHADKSKYGSLMKNLHSQYSLGNNQFPSEMATATNVLSSNHTFDDDAEKPKNKYKAQNKNKSKREVKEAPQLSLAQLEGKCWCCGKGGHYSTLCRLKDTKPKEEWAVSKAMKEEAKRKNTPASSVTSTGIGAHMQCFNDTDMRNVILLGIQASADIFCNPKMVKNIREVDEVLELHTYAGVLYSNKKADLPGYGTVWYNEAAPTNTFSLGNISDKYPVTLDQENQQFVVDTGDKKALFKRTANNVYAFKPSCIT